MNLYLFNIDKDKRVVDKGVTSGDGDEYTNVILKEGTSIIKPTFIMSGFAIDEIPSFNYVYFPKMGRWYFVENITILTGKRISIDCSIDVLHTYRKDIKELTPFIARQEKLGNNELPDGQFPLYSKQAVSHHKIKDFPSGHSIVLTTSGRMDSTANG